MSEPLLSNEHAELTPLMKQYFAIRVNYPDALLFFQVGDFYELFFEDAKTAAAFLGIALTKRGKINGEPIPLCGVPVHALDHYVTKLIKGGFKVALCDQLEEPKPGKLVDRGVTQVLTPGTLTDSKLLDEKSASYLFSFFPLQDSWGLLFGELLTAQLIATVLPATSDKTLEQELVRFLPDEIVIPHSKPGKVFESQFKKWGYYTSVIDTPAADSPQAQAAQEWITKVTSSDATISQHESLHKALEQFHTYVARSQNAALDQFSKVYFYQPDEFLMIDPATVRNLDMVKNANDGSRKNTLYQLLDRAVTPMGSRMLKKWLLRPLVRQESIEKRLDAVQQSVTDPAFLYRVIKQLQSIGDIERVIGRIALRRATFHDYSMLCQALQSIPQLAAIIQEKAHIQLWGLFLHHGLSDHAFAIIAQLLSAAINDDSTKEWIIKAGFDLKLDQMRVLINDANNAILAMEQREQAATGIGSLKIRYNNMQGYYIEITKTHLNSVPAHYIRQQTLVGKERYMTPELQQLQLEIQRAHANITHHEKEVFEHIKLQVYAVLKPLRQLAQSVAHIDAIIGLSQMAYDYGFIRPQFNSEQIIQITQGRHPVVQVQLNQRFIPNDISLTDAESLWIITGPNMGGKSTFLRQTALLCIMAHIGSYVPAQSANIALLDRIFTRIGAGDNLAEGKSTFLVEMEETAAICTMATRKSLVILDEVGRGTSTFDGLAIAQAVVEYLYTTVRARCLFATHYHELALLPEQYPGIVSYYAASKKTSSGIVFLYKIIKGIADGSFGVEVAKLAQLPHSIIKRSEEILSGLTALEMNKMYNGSEQTADMQLIQENKQLRNELAQLQDQLHSVKPAISIDDIDFDNLSPKKAFDLLWKLKE